MNVTENIERIMNAKSDLKMSISNKGVEIPDGTLIDEYSSYVDQISSGGGTIDSGGKYLIQVIDYDGTVLKQDHLNEGDTFTLPEAPARDDRLVFQEWSSPIDIIDNTVTVGDSDITIGAVYETASGATEFDITLTKVTGTTVTLQNITGMTSIDWGDGITNALLTHTYDIIGDYTIKIYGAISLDAYILNQSSDTNAKYICRHCRFGTNVTIESASLRACYSLETVTIPKNIVLTATSFVSDCRSLKSLTFPNGSEAAGCGGCWSLKSVAIPKSVTTINDFNYCHSLKSITIPNGVTEISGNTFLFCYSLKSIVFPSSVTSIQFSAFSNTNIIVYDFTKATQVPVLGNTSAFNNINGICKIIVPASLYAEWIAATNWATYADYIYYVGEIPVVTEEISLTVNEYYDGSGSPQWYCRYPTGSAPESPYPVIKLFKDEDYENNLMSGSSEVAQGYMEGIYYPGQGLFYLNTDFYDDGSEVQYGYYTANKFKVLIPGKYEWIGYYPETGIPIRKYILNVT